MRLQGLGGSVPALPRVALPAVPLLRNLAPGSEAASLPPSCPVPPPSCPGPPPFSPCRSRARAGGGPRSAQSAAPAPWCPRVSLTERPGGFCVRGLHPALGARSGRQRTAVHLPPVTARPRERSGAFQRVRLVRDSLVYWCSAEVIVSRSLHDRIDY